MINRCWVWASILLVLGVSGCARQPPPPSARIAPDLRVTLRLAPEPARSLDPTVFTVRVQDHQGRPVPGATVIISLTMPAMEMGRNEVVAAPKGAGVYVGTGRFTMAGEWKATVTASQGDRRTVQSFTEQVH